MSLKNSFFNTIFLAGSLPEYLFFKNNFSQAAFIQQRKLLQILRGNAQTEFGREHSFPGISTVQEYQARVPVRDYEALEPWLKRTRQGRPNVLTREKVRLFEPTGGTTAGSKLIPCTAALKREFQQGVNPWLSDMYLRHRNLLQGKAYWSVSPAGQKQQQTTGGIPIGFEDDTAYLGLLGLLLKQIMAVPPWLKQLQSIENFRYATAFFLLAATDLVLISVWNPTFLLLILDTLQDNRELLLRDMAEGRIRLPAPARECFSGKAGEILRVKAAPRRSRQLAELWTRHKNTGYSGIWPRLQIISCWRDGEAGAAARRLEHYFPHARVIGKGLTATEGIVTIPWTAAGGCLPAYTSHFFEFLPDEGKKPLLLHELEPGRHYKVVLTTGSGLYRYALHDRLLVEGRFKGLPLLKFTGRDGVCDLVGEKLPYSQVAALTNQLRSELGRAAIFLMVAPQRGESLQDDNHHFSYTLYIEVTDQIDNSTLSRLGRQLEDGFKTNFHYQYALNLGQLWPLRVFRIGHNGTDSYFKRCLAGGQRMGDIKPVALDPRSGWQKYFYGNFIPLIS